MNAVKAVRENIVGYAENSAGARQQWAERPDIDVWLIRNTWPVSNPTLVAVVEIEPEHAIFRDTGVALTTQDRVKKAAQLFVDCLAYPDGAKISRKWGWKASDSGTADCY
jgi:accessory colonization factor AcfC